MAYIGNIKPKHYLWLHHQNIYFFKLNGKKQDINDGNFNSMILKIKFIAHYKNKIKQKKI